MELRLEGHFSYIDNYNKLKFTFLDGDNTSDKLAKHCGGSFTPEGFTISMPYRMLPTDDIRGLVGLDCTIHVRLKPYHFVSKLEKNFGEKVCGARLILTNICKRE